jgi:dienelactone hydrolase
VKTRLAVAVAALVLIGAGCSSSAKSSNGTTATTVAGQGGDPAYAKAGPYAVGYTTLHLPDRDVAVWYPTDAASIAGKKKATYDQTAPLPANLKGIVPPQYNTVVTMNAYQDVPSSTKGPFPVLLFSHGAGGYDLVYSALTAGIASWGFVVVSADYKEYGLAAQVTGAKYPRDPNKGKDVMLASLDLVEKASGDASSVLHGSVNPNEVAAAGHSAGGNTAFNALNDPRVKVAIGWAPVAPTGAPANKPTMIIGTPGDTALTPATLTQEYTSFPAPKRFFEIGNANDTGHNLFTDICVVIRGGGGLVSFAVSHHLVSQQLVGLATNGCAKTDLDPTTFWPIVQHLTVAELRSTFGIDPQPVGLGDAITTAFPPIPIQYQHTP